MSRLVAQWESAGLGRIDTALVTEGYAYRDTPRTGIRPLPANELASALALAPIGMGGVHVFDSEDAVEAAGMRLSGDVPSHYAVQVMHADGDATATLARFADEDSAHEVAALLARLSNAQEAVADAQDAVVAAMRYGGRTAPGGKTPEQRIELATRRVRAWQRMTCSLSKTHEGGWHLLLATVGDDSTATSLAPLARVDACVVERVIEHARELEAQLEGVRAAHQGRCPIAMGARVEALDLDRLVGVTSAWQLENEQEFDNEMGAMTP